MYPDLSYLFHALIGTEPDNWLSIFKTFGFFLSIAFLCSAVVFYYELKRKAKLGFFNPAEIKVTEGGPTSISEIITNAVIGLIIGGKGWYAYEHYESFRHDPASVILSQHFAWIPGIIGAVLFGGYSWWESVRRQKKGTITRLHTQYPHHRISEFTIWAAVGGILGAKIFDVFDNWDTFIDDPVGTLASGGGLAFFGGLVFGFIAVVTFMVRNKIPFLPTADAVAPALATGYGVGRIGCQFSGDGDWGIVNANPKPGWLQWMPDNWWATTYPHHVLNTPHTDPVPSIPIENCTWDYCMQLSQPVYPTPFYEVVMMTGIVGFLWLIRKKITLPGLLFFIYLALIAIERFFIEKIRVNVRHDLFGLTLTQAEIISMALFLIALSGSLFLWKNKSKSIPAA